MATPARSRLDWWACADACDVCGQTGVWPRVAWGPADGQAVLTVCVGCIGRAVQDVTGWRLLNVLAQWQAIREADVSGYPLRFGRKPARSSRRRRSPSGGG